MFKFFRGLTGAPEVEFPVESTTGPAYSAKSMIIDIGQVRDSFECQMLRYK